jgi:hypothetical protein
MNLPILVRVRRFPAAAAVPDLQHLRDALRRHRSTEQIALHLVAIVREQEVALLDRFHALRDHGQRDRLVVGAGSQVAHERLADLERRDRERF